MHYLHDLYHQFDQCDVTICLAEGQRITPCHRFSSMMSAIDFLLEHPNKLEFAVMTAHTPEGLFDIDQQEILTLTALQDSVRHCQD